jgi:hypothetical protein
LAQCVPDLHWPELRHWSVTLKSLRWEQLVDFCAKALGLASNANAIIWFAFEVHALSQEQLVLRARPFQTKLGRIGPLIVKYWSKAKFGLKSAKQVPIGLSSDDVASGYTGFVEAILLVLLLLLLLSAALLFLCLILTLACPVPL